MADNESAAQKASAKVSEQMKAAAETMQQTGQKAAASGAELGMRLLDQAETNTREAFAAMRAAASARDVGDVMRIQGEYLREQGTRSMTQAREIAEMITGFGRDAISQLTAKR